MWDLVFFPCNFYYRVISGFGKLSAVLVNKGRRGSARVVYATFANRVVKLGKEFYNKGEFFLILLII